MPEVPLTPDAPRPFPIQDGLPVPWECAERAYQTYSRLFGRSQSLERLAGRGGFGRQEFACLFMGHHPERGHAACVEASDALGRELARLREENRRLRWRLNHQTGDDAEACRQGRHPPDCGVLP